MVTMNLARESMSVGEVARDMAVSDQTVRNWIRDGWLVARQNGVRQTRIRRSDYEEFLRRRMGLATPPTTLLTGFLRGGWLWAMQWIGQFADDAVMDMEGWKFTAQKCHALSVCEQAQFSSPTSLWIEQLFLAIYEWFALRGQETPFTVADFAAVLESVKGFAYLETQQQDRDAREQAE